MEDGWEGELSRRSKLGVGPEVRMMRGADLGRRDGRRNRG